MMLVLKLNMVLVLIVTVLLSSCGLASNRDFYSDLPSTEKDKYTGIYVVTESSSQAPGGTYVLVHNEHVRNQFKGGALHFLTVFQGKVHATPAPVYEPTVTFKNNEITNIAGRQGKAIRAPMDSLPAGDLVIAVKLGEGVARLQQELRVSNIQVELFKREGNYVLELSEEQVTLVKGLIEKHSDFADYLSKNRISQVNFRAEDSKKPDAMILEGADSVNPILRVYSKTSGAYPTAAELLGRMRANSIPRL